MENLELELMDCVRRERDCLAEVLRYLREVEKARLYLERGYSSLFAYCVGRLGYSEHEANLRIQAMRLVRAVPEVGVRLQKGELSLSVAGQVQGVVRREKLGPKEARELLLVVGGTSKREAEKKIAELYPSKPKREGARFVSKDLVDVRLTLSREEYELMQEVMNLRALPRKTLRPIAAGSLCETPRKTARSCAASTPGRGEFALHQSGREAPGLEKR